MINYTSIEIRKTAPSTFEIYDNTSPNVPTSSSSYEGLIEPFQGIANNDSTLTITTNSGHPLYNHQRWQVFTYNDALNPTNSFVPVSGIDLHRKLIARGFYVEGNIDMPVDIIDQDNIRKIKGFRYPLGDALTKQQIVDMINAQPQFTISQIESYSFRGTQYQNNANNFPIPTGASLLYELINKGKGTYGAGGIQLTTNDIVLVENQEVTADDIANMDSTQVVPYTLAENQDIYQWLNTQNPAIALQDQENGYILFRGLQGSYIFVGDGGLSYGVNAEQSTENDFEFFGNDVLPSPTPPAEITARMLLVTVPQADTQFISPDLIGAEIVMFTTDGQTFSKSSINTSTFTFDSSLGKVYDVVLYAGQIITVIYTKP